jgi:diguanylate cyclase (GGDEF)-like protein
MRRQLPIFRSQSGPVARLTRLSSHYAEDRASTVRLISIALSCGGIASLILLLTVLPRARTSLAFAGTIAVVVYGAGSFLAVRKVGDRYPGFLLDLGILLTSAAVALGALAYPRSPLAVAILSFFIWGSINTFTLLPKRKAMAHNLLRIAILVAVLSIDHEDVAAVAPVLAIGVLYTGLSAGKLSERLRRQALIDPLTNAPNRQALALLLVHELARAARSGRPLTIAMIDVDHFKSVNDTLGHAAGDRLLIEVTAAWRELLRSSDIVARYAGDEFVVLLPECPLEQARMTLGRLTRAASRSCSIGAVQAEPDEAPDMVLRRADNALYRAKESGRARVICLPLGESVAVANPPARDQLAPIDPPAGAWLADLRPSQARGA